MIFHWFFSFTCYTVNYLKFLYLIVISTFFLIWGTATTCCVSKIHSLIWVICFIKMQKLFYEVKTISIFPEAQYAKVKSKQRIKFKQQCSLMKHIKFIRCTHIYYRLYVILMPILFSDKQLQPIGNEKFPFLRYNTSKNVYKQKSNSFYFTRVLNVIFIECTYNA